MTTIDPFPASALSANRAGRLTEDQRRSLKPRRRVHWRGLALAFACAIPSALVLTITGPALAAGFGPNGTAPNQDRPDLAIGAGLAAVAAIVFIYVTAVRGPLTRDLAEGRVESVEGAIGKHMDLGRGASAPAFYLDVNGKSYRVGAAAYDAAPGAGWIRLYLLPRTRAIVNLEWLPDRLPERLLQLGASAVEATSAADLSSRIIAPMRSDAPPFFAVRSRGRGGLKRLFDDAWPEPTPRPRHLPDSEALAKHLLGTWYAGPMALTFLPTGTLVTGPVGGRQQRGTWSVEPDGHLRANASGQDQVVEAWLRGDTLTISDGSQPMALRRAGRG